MSHAPVILTVDDDFHLCQLVGRHVVNWGYVHQAASNADALWSALDAAAPSVILLDICLGEQDGRDLLENLKRRLPDVPVLMITGHASIDNAVQCIKDGAFDYVCKPIDFSRLRAEVGKAVEQHRLAQRLCDVESLGRRGTFHGLIGASSGMQAIYERIESIAPTDVSVLILGETGTGKELTARALHECSRRRDGPFVPVNCAAVPAELIESALFGHERGAFTGAHQPHTGYCEQADGGTLFLDEIAEMSYEVQAKLLRFLQDHTVQRVGGKRWQRVDVRVAAATNRDPRAEIQRQRLREDVFYRLNVVTIELPPLRERAGDIPLLAHHFLECAAVRFGRPMHRISPQAMRRLEQHDWNGNVRELQHLIERMVVLNQGEALGAEMLPGDLIRSRGNLPAVRTAHAPREAAARLPTMQDMERLLILEALRAQSWSVPAVAKQLNISAATIYRKIRKYGLTRVCP